MFNNHLRRHIQASVCMFNGMLGLSIDHTKAKLKISLCLWWQLEPCDCVFFLDKCCPTESKPLLLFTYCQELNHYSVTAFLSYPPPWDERKMKCLCLSRNENHTKVRLKCTFPAFCEGVHVAASNGRQYCLKKIMFFSSHGFYCQKAVNHSLRNTKDVQWERPMARSAQSVLFFSPFSLFSIVAHRKRFKWHLTLLLVADMAYSSYSIIFLFLYARTYTCIPIIFFSWAILSFLIF